MDAIFRNSKKSVTSDPRRLLLNPADKIHLKRNDKYVALSNLSIYSTCKNIKMHTKITNLIYQLRHEMKIILYQIFEIILSIP